MECLSSVNEKLAQFEHNLNIYYLMGVGGFWFIKKKIIIIIKKEFKY